MSRALSPNDADYRATAEAAGFTADDGPDFDPEFRQSSLDRLDFALAELRRLTADERAARWPVPTRDVTAADFERFDRERAEVPR